MNGRQMGGFIGAVGGLSFVLANAGALPGVLVLRVAGVAAFVALLAMLILRPPPAPPEPSPGAIRVYWACVAGEIAALPLGAAGFRALDQTDLVPAWVVLVVGVHFVPFASAFRLPMFRWLGITMILVALSGMAVTLAGVDEGARAAAAAAGVVLFGAVYAGSRAHSSPAAAAETRAGVRRR
ncbi:MAG: hypothetical protein L0H93_07400 [Nocardioides sp.]|nr:hypothetical protein [Nocardioides sp.]